MASLFLLSPYLAAQRLGPVLIGLMGCKTWLHGVLVFAVTMFSSNEVWSIFDCLQDLVALHPCLQCHHVQQR